jgi:hypothetical protein
MRPAPTTIPIAFGKLPSTPLIRSLRKPEMGKGTDANQSAQRRCFDQYGCWRQPGRTNRCAQSSAGRFDALALPRERIVRDREQHVAWSVRRIAAEPDLNAADPSFRDAHLC